MLLKIAILIKANPISQTLKYQKRKTKIELMSHKDKGSEGIFFMSTVAGTVATNFKDEDRNS